jgi:hypothetical protein
VVLKAKMLINKKYVENSQLWGFSLLEIENNNFVIPRITVKENTSM